MNRTGLTAALGELRIRPLFESGRWNLVCDESFEKLIRSWGEVGKAIIPVSSLAENAQLRQLKGPVAVCTEKPEGPFQQLLREHGLPSLGLFSQIVPRLAAGLPPRYALPAEHATKLEFAILCSGRCGSTLLARELRAAGAGKPGEHLRPPVRTLLRHRDVSGFDFHRWWDLVRRGHTVDGVFGTKIIYGFWLATREQMTEDERKCFLDFLGRATIIHIYRRDRIAQAVSDFVANKTGVWHIFKGAERESYDVSAARIDADVANLVDIYDRYSRHEDAIARLMKAAGGRLLQIEYEELARDPKQVVAGAMGALGLKVSNDYFLTDVTLEPTTTVAHQQLGELLRRAVAN